MFTQTQVRPLLEISQLFPVLSWVPGREAWQPWRSPQALSACPGGFPRKPACRLVSAEPGFQLPAPLLAVGKFLCCLGQMCVRKGVGSQRSRLSYTPGSGCVSTSSIFRRVDVLGRPALAVVPAARHPHKTLAARGPGAGSPICVGTQEGAVDGVSERGSPDLAC